MVEGKPGQISENPIDEFRPASARIEILDSQEEPAPARLRMGMAQSSRKSMAQVKSSRRRGGETCDFQDSLLCQADQLDS